MGPFTGWTEIWQGCGCGDSNHICYFYYSSFFLVVHIGDALVTISTGKMSESEADAVGLVPSHAYAVLDVREVNGLQLLRVKNPWSHKRWIGPYSHLDGSSWTPELMRELDYDRIKAAFKDDGIFWIDFDSVCKNFDSIYMNWNPELFPHINTLHTSWPLNPSVNKDTLHLGYNPQYCFEVRNDDDKPSAVRLLLSRHIVFTEENREFITLHVYEGTNGERVYYLRKPWKMGVFVDSPHVSVRFNAPPGKSRYTIVVAQLEKMKSLEFTLKSYCMSPVTMTEIPKKCPIEFQVSGKWTNLTAGGNSNYVSYLNNPQYCLSLPTTTKLSSGTTRVMLMLEGPRTFAMNVMLVWGKGKRISSVSSGDIVVRSHGYQRGFCHCEIDDIRLGDYTIVVSTFEPDMIGDYKLTVASNIAFKVTPIPLEGAGLFKKTIQGEWISGSNAMGCTTNSGYKHNPSYHLTIKEMTTIKIRLQTPTITPINIRIFEKHPTKLLGKEVGSSGGYAIYLQGVFTDDVSLPPHNEGYIVVFSTSDKDVSGKFNAYFYSDRNIVIVPIENNS